MTTFPSLEGAVYDDRQHINLFNGPGAYLFRGTLPSEAFHGPYHGPGVTPTSIDPIVAPMFACRYRMEGPAIVLVARKSDFNDLLDGPNLASFQYELAVNIELAPPDFEPRCQRRIGVGGSLESLRKLGYELPSRLPDLGALCLALVNTPRMPIEDIERYLGLCQQASAKG